MKRNKKRNRIILLLILVIGISIGYAALANMIKINGTSVVKGSKWNIYWDNVNVDSGSVSGSNVITTPTTTGTTTTEVEFSVVLPEPGDYYEFTIDAVNAGSIDAMIENNGVQNKVYSDSACTQEATLPDVVKYTVTNLDGTAIESGHVLSKKSGNTPTKETYKVRVEYRNDEEINPSDLDKDNDKTYYFKFAVTYVQSSSSEEPVVKNYVCKKATTLDTEVCTGYISCKTEGGYEEGSTITYGHTNGDTLTSGYALDCDVSGNGDYERFYYVSDLYTGTTGGVDQFDSDYAVLIYNRNYAPNGGMYYYENSAVENWHGPVTLLSTLPTRSNWTNEKIGLKSNLRNIVNELGGNTTDSENRTIENPFNYAGTVARLLTIQEVNKSCNITAGNMRSGELTSCEYLLEGLDYGKSNSGFCDYWLENPLSENSRYEWRVMGSSAYISDNYSGSNRGVRPVIEVKKSDISLD